MSNWLYAQKVPTEVWRSAMTLPRTIKLFSDENGYYLKNYPIENFSTLYSSKNDYPNEIDLKEDITLDSSNFSAVDISFQMNLSKDLQLEFYNAKDEKLVFEMDSKTSELKIDRKTSGLTDFEEHFATNIKPMPYNPEDRIVEVRLIVDEASMEIFVDKGKYALTNIMFPTENYSKLKLTSEDDTVLTNFKVNNVKSIWNNEK